MSDSLQNLRSEIDQIDQDLVKLLDRRASVVEEIGKIKHQEGLDLYVPGREREIIDRLESLGSGDFPKASLRFIFREIITTCLNLEKPVTVGFLGPEATFTHSAALKRFGQSTDLQSFRTVSEVFREVERENVDFGLVPIENSSEGAVRHTLDRFLESNLSITSECYLRISLCIVSNADELSEIETIYSHGQALSQADDWIKHNLPQAEIQDTNSTAEAAKIISDKNNAAAITSEVAADIYDLKLLERDIENPAINYTRFLVLGQESPKPTGDDKTTIAFSLQDRIGALHKILEPFGELDINMTKIESRPSRENTWDYIFFVDFQGHKDDPEVQELINQLETFSRMFKLLGSYPRENPFD